MLRKDAKCLMTCRSQFEDFVTSIGGDRSSLQEAFGFQSRHSAADLGLVQVPTIADVPCGHGAILTQMKKHAPLRSKHAEFAFVHLLELAADLFGSLVQLIGQKVFQIKNGAISLIVTFSTNTVPAARRSLIDECSVQNQ